MKLTNLFVKEFPQDWTIKQIVDLYEDDIWEYLWDEKGYMWEYGDDG